MTAQEWVGCADPISMLEFLRDCGRADERKLRLFAVACCRRIWPLLRDGRSRKAVELAERVADGFAGEQELVPSDEAAHAALVGAARANFYPAAEQAAVCLTSTELAEYDILTAAGRTAAHAANALYHATSKEVRVWHAENTAQCDLLRDIFRPFAPPGPRFAPSWRTPQVLALARTAYEERRWDDLPLLADALEEAGCADEAILAHLRGPGPHARGCWAVDLVLGNEGPGIGPDKCAGA